MRKVLITLVTILLAVLVGWVCVNGINMGPINIDGIKGISEKSKQLDSTIQYVATEVNSNNNASKMKKLDEAYKKLLSLKEQYEKVTVDTNGNPIAEVQEYEIEYLWNQLGNYAKKEGVKVNLEFPVNNSITKTHDIKFTVSGSYISVTDFLYLLEADTKLPFKIESFKLLPSGGDSLVATFTCKDVKINIEDFNNATENNGTNDNQLEESTNKEENTSTNSTTNNSSNSTTNTNTNTTNNNTNSNTNTNTTNSNTNSTANNSTNTNKTNTNR